MRQYLDHTDRERGKQQADAMAAAFGKDPTTERNASQTLQSLFDIYLREVTPTNVARRRAKKIGAAFMFVDDEEKNLRERCRFRAWWLRAEKLAKLEHDDRWDWHSLRRKFATELKDIPL